MCEFVFRCAGTRCGRCGRRINGYPFDLPPHIGHDTLDRAHDATGGIPEGRDRGDFLVAEAAR